ncbi:MAG: IS5 family transposase, partial [Methanobacteriota archaeon]
MRSGAEIRLTDEQWARVEPLLPKWKPSKKGGRPWADNRGVFEGILWVLRTGARWRDLPEEYPSPATCWRRLNRWEQEGVWEDVWQGFLRQLDMRSMLDWQESFIDATFM